MKFDPVISSCCGSNNRLDIIAAQLDEIHVVPIRPRRRSGQVWSIQSTAKTNQGLSGGVVQI